MKHNNVDFLVDECRRILRIACAINDVDKEMTDDIVTDFNVLIQDEYKYLLRGPR